jgi:hypothetical protein
MKKLILLTFVLLISTSILAQEEESSKLKLSLNARPHLAWLKVASNEDRDIIDEIENKGVKIGFSYGISADIFFTKNYALCLEFFHVLSGGATEVRYKNDLTNGFSNFSGGRDEIDWNMQFVQLPFSLKMKSNEIGYMTYFVKFGGVL